MSSRPVQPRPADHGEQSLAAEVFKLGRDLRTAIDRELAPHGITTQQAAVMLVARLHGMYGPGYLADPLGTDTAGMTRLVDRLEAKGFVTRQSSQTDRRSIVIELTPAGQALAPALIRAFRHAQQKLLDGMDRSEVEQFRATIRRLRENLRQAASVGGTC